jgi:molybdopterin synthase catalytic subunit
VTFSLRAGAVSTFMGTTRDNFEDKEVTYLEYEAYPEMALESMLSICNEVCHSVKNSFLNYTKNRFVQDGQ